MDWNALLEQVLPILSELMVAVVSALLIFLSAKANAWIKSNTDASQLDMINLVAKNIVLFLEKVAEARGWESSADKKEYAVQRLISDMAKLGVSVSLEQADVAIEAAVMEFTENLIEMVEMTLAQEPVIPDSH